jgi:hypothetical protein
MTRSPAGKSPHPSHAFPCMHWYGCLDSSIIMFSAAWTRGWTLEPEGCLNSRTASLQWCGSIYRQSAGIRGGENGNLLLCSVHHRAGQTDTVTQVPSLDGIRIRVASLGPGPRARERVCFNFWAMYRCQTLDLEVPSCHISPHPLHLSGPSATSNWH